MNTKNASLFLVLAVFFLSLTPLLYAESDGTWACKLGGTEWKDAKSGASLNAGNLTLYSSDDRLDGIYIMTIKPAAVGSYDLNDAAQASFADATGANHRSKAGSGKLVISKYAAPDGGVKGRVEGTFSADFDAGTSKELALRDCTFNLPVKNL